MSFILTRVEVGQVGDLPGQLLLESTDDLVTITSPGYLSISDNVLPTDFITAVYGTPMVNKQQFNPVFGPNNVITLEIIGGGGSINGAVNIGTGEGILGVSGDNITGKTFIAGANITLTPTATDITIAATGSGGGTITGIADASTNEGNLAAGTSGSDVLVKSLIAGSNVVITENSTSVTIAATNSSTGLTTLANLPGDEGIYQTTVGTTAFLKSLSAGAGIALNSTADTINIVNVGSGGETFPYENAYWLAANGDDANPGTSIDAPKATMGAIASLLVSGIPTVINIVDTGTYSISSTFTIPCPLLINAPGATFEWSGGPSGNMFYTDLAAPLIIYAGIINGNSNLSQIFMGLSSIFCNCTAVLGIYPYAIWQDANTVPGAGVPQAVFNLGSSGGGSFIFGAAGDQVINSPDLGLSIITSTLPSGSPNKSCQINSNYLNGRIQGSADFDINIATLGFDYQQLTSGVVTYNVGKSNVDVTTLPNYNGIVGSNPTSGDSPLNVLGNALYMNQNPIIQEIYDIIFTAPSTGSWSVIPGVQNGNGMINIPSNAAAGTITLPSGSGVPYGWRFYSMQTQFSSGSAVQVTPGSNDTIYGQDITSSTSCYTGRGIQEYIRGSANGSGGYAWAITGCFATN